MQLAQKFGKYKLGNRLAINQIARKGIETTVFYGFAHMVNIPEKTLAGLLNVHPRTIQNYKEQHKSLQPAESEHLLKLIDLFAKGEEMFGDLAEFNSWLKKPFWNGKETPQDWLITPGGVDLVAEEVERLAHGYAV
jgi:putative toxin-antitoxin system antitoxin component (TIGR02293 family)